MLLYSFPRSSKRLPSFKVPVHSTRVIAGYELIHKNGQSAGAAGGAGRLTSPLVHGRPGQPNYISPQGEGRGGATQRRMEYFS